MSDPHLPPTSLTLLAALRRGLRWEEFVALYGRQVLSWCRHRFGLQEADAEDVRQELLVRVWRYLGSYDPARGRFRSWLFRCTAHALSDLEQRRRAGREPVLLTSEALAGLADGGSSHWPPASPEWDEGDLEGALRHLEEEGFAEEELQAAVLRVRDRVSATTWKAFLMSVFLDLKGPQVASRLGMTPMAVYQAVCRVRRLLEEAARKEHGDEPPER
jgi:RNA polymerase sigma-70 factor (ECF subfamily)